MEEVTLQKLIRMMNAHPEYMIHLDTVKGDFDKIPCKKCREIRVYGDKVWNRRKKPISERIQAKNWGDFTRAEYDRLRALEYIDKDIYQYFGIGNTTFQDWKKAMKIQRKYKRGKLAYG